MYKLTAADFADTGQWRLLLEIESTGLVAFLENTIHPEIPPQTLCSASWEINKDKLRQNIEDAVYKNPRLLDDFATRIILFDQRTLFIPTHIAEEKIGSEEEIYQKIYTADDSDIMTDSDRDITAVWAMSPGVKSFLMRTFPGSRITCNLLDKVRYLRKRNEGASVFAFVRKTETDIILLDGDKLISASTHDWGHPDDIAYLVLNLLNIYHFPLGDVKVEVNGLITATEAWTYILSKARSFQNNSSSNENN